ncbi:hypothetical protein D9M72_561560 [compost metagenome]
MAGFSTCCGSYHQNIAVLRKLQKAWVIVVSNILLCPASIADLSIKALQPPGNCLADTTQAKDPIPPPTDACAKPDFGFWPISLTHMCIRSRNVARLSYNETNRRIGHISCQNIRRI